MTSPRLMSISSSRRSVTALGAQGSHVFDDADVKMLIVSGQATFAGQADSSLQLIGSYVAWDEATGLEAMIRRQNTRVLGQLVEDYRVVDLQARIRPAFDPPPNSLGLPPHGHFGSKGEISLPDPQ